jgi:DNA repair exonuclease SbcCD ATPase subunit
VDIKGKVNNKECPYCFAEISESNFKNIIDKANDVIELKKVELEELKIPWNKIAQESKELEAQVDKVQKGLTNTRKQLDLADRELTGIYAKIAELSKIKEPQADVDERLMQEQIEELKKQLVAKKAEVAGTSPFVKIYEEATAELATKTKEVNDKEGEVKQAEGELPYYDFWVKAFGDNGIRKYVIDGIVPTLNNRIAYWLQFLIDNKIKLSFDNQLQETIDRYPFLGRPYVYHGCSGGQRRRLNLAVAASFAYIQLLRTGCYPSAMFVDEPSMNIDEIGVLGIYRMICELAKERQVFVIDHNQALLQMLDGCNKIHLVMENEVTTKA